MKPLLKMILLMVNMVVPYTYTFSSVANADIRISKVTNNDVILNSDDQKTAYALGASLGRYIENSLKEQENLGVKIDKFQLITGIQDVINNKNKFSDQEIKQILQALEKRVKGATQKKIEKDAKENEIKGKVFREKFAKEKGVKISSTGLLYKIEKVGTGETPKDTDTVVVNYKGSLINGKEFDNSYIRGEPFSFRLDSAIPGWIEGLKNIKTGGKIKLVIPPNLAYAKTSVPGIPANSTLVFDIELQNIKSNLK